MKAYAVRASIVVCSYVLLACTASASIKSHQSASHQADKILPKSFKYIPHFRIGPFYETNSGALGLYDLLVPFTVNQKSVVFFDGRIIDRSGPSFESNLGLGFRQINHDNTILWSVYSFFDQRRSKYRNHFSQVTVGWDMYTKDWYFNMNGYIPTGRRSAFVSALDAVELRPIGNGVSHIYYARGQETGLGGFDTEVGYTIPQFRFLTAYLGAYVFARTGVKTAAGPNLRLELSFERAQHRRILGVFNKVTFVSNYRYDQLFGSNWYGGMRVDIALGVEPPMHGLENKMMSFIRRDIDVELDSDSGNTSNLHVAFKPLLNRAGAIARVMLPSNNAVLTTAVTPANSIDIIGLQGTIDEGGTAQTLADNQTLTGGNFPFTADNHQFNIQLGHSGGLSNGAAGNLVTIGTNDTVINSTLAPTAGGVALQHTSAAGVGTTVVEGDTVTDGRLLEVSVNTAADTSNIILQDNTVADVTAGAAGEAVVEVTDTSGAVDLTLDGNSLSSSNANVADVALSSGASGVLSVDEIKDNTLSSTANSALEITGVAAPVAVSGPISGNTITAADDGIVFDGTGATGSVTVSGAIQNNSISSSTTTGQEAPFEALGNVTFTGDIVNNRFTNTGTGRPAFEVAPDANHTVTLPTDFRNNKVTANTTDGAMNIVTVANSSVVAQDLRNNTITNTGTGAGIELASPDTSSITTNDIRNNKITVGAGAGISLNSTGGDISTGEVRNNNITSGGNGIDVLASTAAGSVSVLEMRNNNINTTGGIGINLVSSFAAAHITINELNSNNITKLAGNNGVFANTSVAGALLDIIGFKNNQITVSGANDIVLTEVAGSTLNVSVLDGNKGLSQSNKNATVVNTGANVVPGV